MKQSRISFTDIFKVLGVLAGLAIIYLIRDILIIVFIAWILASAMSPLVDRLEKQRIPRTITASIMLIMFIVFMGVFFYVTIPAIITQINRLVDDAPELIQSTSNTLRFERFGADIADVERQISQALVTTLSNISTNAISFGRIIVDSLISTLVTAFLTFYFLVDRTVVRKFVTGFFKESKIATEMFNRSEDKLRVWLRGQLTVMLLIGVVTYIALSILRVEFALPLAIIAGLLEIIPFLGPTLSAVPAILIALSESPTKAVIVLFVYFAIQQLEASLVVPKVMDKAVGLNPIVVIIAVMVGSRLLGPVGAIISVPLTAILVIAGEEWQVYRNQKRASKAAP